VASTHNQVILQSPRPATKQQIKERVDEDVRVKVKAVNTLAAQGQVKAFSGRPRVPSDVKKRDRDAREGHRID